MAQNTTQTRPPVLRWMIFIGSALIVGGILGRLAAGL